MWHVPHLCWRVQFKATPSRNVAASVIDTDGRIGSSGEFGSCLAASGDGFLSCASAVLRHNSERTAKVAAKQVMVTARDRSCIVVLPAAARRRCQRIVWCGDGERKGRSRSHAGRGRRKLTTFSIPEIDQPVPRFADDAGRPGFAEAVRNSLGEPDWSLESFARSIVENGLR